MSLCLSAHASPLAPSAPDRSTGLGARLRRLILSFAAPADMGDMLTAPPPARVAAIRARRDEARTPPGATGEVNGLLL